MTYKTSDIIKRARQLADLENSDFISYEENLMLINECYNKLYEKLINHNDKAFIKSVNLTGFSAGENKTVYELPADFWQLYGVRASVSNIPIPRKAQSESDTTNSYDIENDNLVIYGNRIADTLILDYWQRPPMLTYPRKAQRMHIDGILAMYNDNIFAKNSDGDLLVLDADGNVIMTATNPANYYQSFFAGKNALLAVASDETRVTVFKNGTETDFVTSSSVAWVSHGVVYFTAVSGDALEIRTQNNIVAYTLDWPSFVAMATPLNLLHLVFIGKDYFIAVDSDGFLNFVTFDENYIVTETLKSDFVCDVLKPALLAAYYEGEAIYLIDANQNVACFDFSEKEFYEINEDYDAECMAWQGENSGYGYINSSGALCSFYPDTVLDFTHNFYFTLLAYYLAIAYKAKQNADSTALQQMAAEAEEHFYDTIGRDAYNVTRIRNHYA
jgi:hypothetical protein